MLVGITGGVVLVGLGGGGRMLTAGIAAGTDVPGGDRIVGRTGNGAETVVRFDPDAPDRLSSSVLLLAWFPVWGF